MLEILYRVYGSLYESNLGTASVIGVEVGLLNIFQRTSSKAKVRSMGIEVAFG